MQIVQVDAFTDRPFSGNPAAVLVLPERSLSLWSNAGWLQAIAAEMNLSETAFLRRRDGGDYDLRWFTPAVEVELCGHATLASRARPLGRGAPARRGGGASSAR